MVFAAPRKHTVSTVTQPSVEHIMEFLSKIAAVFVTLLLYGVITILQMPKAAHAAPDYSITTTRAAPLPAMRHASQPR